MKFDSLVFIYLFLPFSIIVCRATPTRFRCAMLLFISTAFYTISEKENVLILAAVIGFDYVIAWLLTRTKEVARLQRILLIFSIIKNLGIVIFYGVMSQLYGIHIPLGLSICCMTSLGYILDCYYGWAVWERNPIKAALLISFFPKLYAGPIVGWGRVVQNMQNPHMSLGRLGEGGRSFIRGLAKKVILGDVIFLLFNDLSSLPIQKISVLTVWSISITLALSTYFILSGYCDMAKGIGYLFGFDFPDNFKYPFRAKSINEFFGLFNITINRFLRRYVYVNLGGSHGNKRSVILNIFLLSMLMGLWFGIRLNFMLWGAFLAFFAMLEHYFMRKKTDFIPPLFRWFLCMTVICVSFVFFAGSSVQQSLYYLKTMFGFNGYSVFNADTLYLLVSNYLVLIIAVVLAGGFRNWLEEMLKPRIPRVYGLLCIAVDIALLTLTTAMIL